MSNSDSKRFYTYLHYRLDTMQVFYVGKGCGQRARDSWGRSAHWRRVASKHGYQVEIAAEWRSEREAFEHEIFLIDTFRFMGAPLVNRTDGGEGASGLVLSEEAKERLSIASTKLWSNQDFRDQMLAKHRSPENRAAASKRIREFMATDEWRMARERALETQKSPEHRALLSRKVKESFQTKAGKARAAKFAKNVHTLEAIEKAVRARAKKLADQEFRERLSVVRGGKPFVCHETGEVFISQSIACEKLGLNRVGLCEALSGKRRSTRGYTFSFIQQPALF